MKMSTYVLRAFTRPATHLNIRTKFGSRHRKMKHHHFLKHRVPKIRATKKEPQVFNWQELEAEVVAPI